MWKHQNVFIAGSHGALWVYCQRDMLGPQVVDERYRVQSWVVAAGVLNRKSQTANKGGPPFRGFGPTAQCN